MSSAQTSTIANTLTSGLSQGKKAIFGALALVGVAMSAPACVVHTYSCTGPNCPMPVRTIPYGYGQPYGMSVGTPMIRFHSVPNYNGGYHGGGYIRSAPQQHFVAPPVQQRPSGQTLRRAPSPSWR